MSERFSNSEKFKKTREKPVKTSPNSFWKWPCAFLFMILVCTFGLLFYKMYRISLLPEKIWNESAEKIGGAFSPKFHLKTIVANTIGRVCASSKIVVLTAEISVSLQKSSGKLVFMDLISLGTTTVELLAPQNKIQYIIPTASLTSDCFSYDENAKLLELQLPQPFLDQELIEVQTNPDLIQVKKTIGWGRLSAYSGKALEEQLKKDIRDEVIKEGKNELLAEKAFAEAKKLFENLLNSVIREAPGSEARKIKILIRRKQ